MLRDLSEDFWSKAALMPSSTIREAIRNLNESSVKIVLVIDDAGVFLGTVSDGDIRRGILNGLGLETPIKSVMNANALVVPLQLERSLVMQLMIANKIQQIPIVNENHHVVGLHVWDKISLPVDRSNLMIIMAGGKGTRMRPHTDRCPKPLLDVAGKPMLEHIIERAKLDGFNRFVISIGYLGHMIEEYFGDGSRLEVQLEYLREESPLGTAGALSLLNPMPNAPFVVTNGDVITDIRYGELLDFHVRHAAVATMAVHTHELRNPFGVVQLRGIEIVGFEEKPITQSYINAGIYVLEPTAIDALSIGEYCDMPMIFERLHAKKQYTVAYPMHEPWLDVGRPDDFYLANNP